MMGEAFPLAKCLGLLYKHETLRKGETMTNEKSTGPKNEKIIEVKLSAADINLASRAINFWLNTGTNEQDHIPAGGMKRLFGDFQQALCSHMNSAREE